MSTTADRDVELKEKLKDNPEALAALENMLGLYDKASIYEKVVFKVLASIMGVNSKIKKDPSLGHLKLDIFNKGFEMIRQAAAIELLEILSKGMDAAARDAAGIGADKSSAEITVGVVGEGIGALLFLAGTNLNKTNDELKNLVEAAGFNISRPKKETSESRQA